MSVLLYVPSVATRSPRRTTSTCICGFTVGRGLTSVTSVGKPSGRKAHLRRHILIHKRTENYNSRQRKLRNVVVQEVDGSSGENEAAKSVEASLITDGTGYVPETAVVQESTNPESDPSTGLASGCIVRVVIESSEAVMEEAVSNQNLRHHVETVDSFSVPEVLQRTQLVTEAYQTIDMEGIVENLSVSKT